MPAELLLSVVLLAAQSPVQGAAPTAPPPDPELLEFLGSFATEEGDYLDPFILAEVDIEAPEQQTVLQQTAQDESEPAEQTRDATEPAASGGEQP